MRRWTVTFWKETNLVNVMFSPAIVAVRVCACVRAWSYTNRRYLTHRLWESHQIYNSSAAAGHRWTD